MDLVEARRDAVRGIAWPGVRADQAGEWATAATARSDATASSSSTCRIPVNQKEIGRFEPPAQYSGMGIAFHTIYCGMLERRIVISNGETKNADCNKIYLPNWIIDIRDEAHPIAIGQLPRPIPSPEAPYRDFCFKRGRFGTHNPPHVKAPGMPFPNFIAYSCFNAGPRCYLIVFLPDALSPVVSPKPPIGTSQRELIFGSVRRSTIKTSNRLIYS